MTREEAYQKFSEWRNLGFGHSTMPGSEVLVMAMKSLRPITRKQVEKMRGKYIPQVAAENSILWGIEHAKCSVCGSIAITENGNGPDFCCHCGSPMTDKAVDILWKRLEAMQDAQKSEI